MTCRLRRWAVFSGLWMLAAAPSAYPQKPEKPTPPATQEQEPPEEDESLKPKEYSFNPLEAAHDLKVGGYYFKKGNYKAAQRRFSEATKWDPGFAEAYLRLGEASDKLRDHKAAKEAYAKYLELAPDSKEAGEVKKKLAHK